MLNRHAAIFLYILILMSVTMGIPLIIK